MNTKLAKQAGLELMANAELVYFTTVDGKGFPQTRVMANIRNQKQFPDLAELFNEHKDDYLIYLVAHSGSPKIKQIKENPKASVYYCRPDEIHGMMVAGNVEILQDKELKNKIWRKEWENEYPGGHQGPEFTIIRLMPLFARGCHKNGPFEFELNQTL
jgi:general stress protein 26